MKIQLEIEVVPFEVPDHVDTVLRNVPENGCRLGSSIPLSELSEQALTQLCDAFRARVFQLAGKQDPESATALLQRGFHPQHNPFAAIAGTVKR